MKAAATAAARQLGIRRGCVCVRQEQRRAVSIAAAAATRQEHTLHDAQLLDDTVGPATALLITKAATQPSRAIDQQRRSFSNASGSQYNTPRCTHAHNNHQSRRFLHATATQDPLPNPNPNLPPTPSSSPQDQHQQKHAHAATSSNNPTSTSTSSAATKANKQSTVTKATTHKPRAAATEGGPAALYEQKVKQGILRNDPHQLEILRDLQVLYQAILAYVPPPVPVDTTADLKGRSSRRGGIFSSLFGSSPEPPPIPPIPKDVPNSLYLFGDVGCGKSMLMDLLYEALPSVLGKRRVHFHAFMIDVHKRLHKLASTHEASKGDAIVPVARELAKEGRILCFDEFQVTDIADAMILRRLFESLIGYGFVIVMTSNRAPDELYKNGIQRSSFIPCIELIKERCLVRDLDSPTDYRKLPRALSKVYYHPLTPENRLEFDKIFEGVTDGQRVVLDREIEVWGRKLRVPQSSKTAASFTFAELCGQPLSAADYLEIVNTFDTIFVEDVPQLTLSERDQARRFILFIDAAYESKTKLFTLSDVPITQIFSDKRSDSKSASSKKGSGGKEEEEEAFSAYQRSMMDDLGLNADTVGASSIFTGDEEVFAFARAVSRLSEMGSVAWAERVRAGQEE